MAIDHFEKHKWQKGRVDWNFNFLFDDQPQVAELAAKYAPLLEHPGLYRPVPGKWLHSTLLRVGFLEEFGDDEMLAVTDRLESKLATVKMPQMILGQWWIWGGNPCLHFTPDDPMRQIFRLLVESLTEIAGKARLPENLSFTPHISLAYSKTYDDEIGLFKQLHAHPIEAVGLRVTNLSLIKQQVIDDYYAWEIINNIDLVQEYR